MINIFFHNFPDDTRYAFAVAKIRALESKMLDQSIITRLLKSNSTDELIKILMDTEYTIPLNEAAGLPFETALDKELQRSLNTIHSIDPDPCLSDIFRLIYDAHNLKVILKSYPFNAETAIGFLLPYGLIDPQVMLKSVEQEEFDFLPPTLAEAVEMLPQGEKESRKRAVDIDFAIDRALFQYLDQEAEKSKNIFIIHLIDSLIDFFNILGFLRSKEIQSSMDIFQAFFLPGGKIKKDQFFTQNELGPDETIRDIIHSTPYADLISFIDSKNLAILEAAMENFLISFLKQTRQRTFGVEPLIGYMFAKELEIKNLRLLYIGKANGLEESLIKQRLRQTYV